MVWDLARPAYNRATLLLAKNGLQRNINGTDLLRVHASFRGVQEIYEPEAWSYVMASLQPGDCMVDVGAHIGLYALAAAKHLGPHGRVYACEPDTGNRTDLIEHIRLNGLEKQILCLPVAIGSSDGLVGFTPKWDSESHIAATDEASTSEVVCVRLDTLFRANRVDILKIDVEGFEEHVLRGATELLSDFQRRPRLICMEVHPYAWSAAGTAPDAILVLLEALRYRVYRASGETVRSIEDYGHVFARPT